MTDDTDEPLPAEASIVLSQWATSEPLPGFADRVIAAAQRRPVRAPARRWWWIGAVFVAAAAVAGSLIALGRGGSAEEGTRVVRVRETIRIGERGVAVAEADTELAWAIAADGAAEVHQSSGDVFYRVERHGPFVVETPYGRVIVHGTCFRVEVQNMNVSRQTWIGGVVGAALAATVVIAVYEGRVRVVNARGHADARAGDRVALGPGSAPARLESGTAEAAITPITPIATLEPPPTGSISMPELLRRDQSHRGEIALLRARVRALETTTGAAPDAPAVASHRDGQRKTFDLSQEELVDMAKNCEIRYDVPGYGLEPQLMTDKLAAATRLSADERAIYDQTVRKENDRYMTALRGLYQELTGGDPDNLEPNALFTEILRKSPTPDVVAARKRLAAERAGLAPPPADARGQSVIERLFRLQSAAGPSLEQLLAAELGPDKAHQIRQGGWAGGDDAIMYSCDD